MIYSRSSNIIHSATSSLYSPTNIFQFHPPSSPWQSPFCSLFLWVWFFFFLLHKNDAIQYSPFPVWLISLSIVTSRLLHVFTIGKISFFLMAWITFYWVIFHIFFIHASKTDNFQILAIVNNAAMHMKVYISL